MSDTIRCPDCGRENDASRERCAQCNFPLREGAPPLTGASRTGAPAAEDPSRPSPGSPFAAPGSVLIPPRRPIRPRRPRPAADQTALQLWLLFGTVAVAAVLWVAIQTNVQRATPQVAGASAEQQKRIDDLREALGKDSTDVASHRALADVLYDTANWPEAIVHYRAAIRRDSTLVTAIVDLGVCYYNLGESREAERLFLLALAKDPHQSVALFNLGIVHQGRDENEQALDFYHRAMQADPPEQMKPVLEERMAQLMDKLGKKAPPLPQSR